MRNDMSLKGKTALVTGAAQRVGRVIAESLARRGASIALHYNRSGAQARALAARLKGEGVQTALFKADLARPKAATALGRDALRRFRNIDILVNNAAIYERTPLTRVTPAQWDAHLDINLRAAFFLCQVIGPAMRRSGGGDIVNIADCLGDRPHPDYIPYGVSKAGVIALTKGLARALAPEVRVNAVLPGAVLEPTGRRGGRDWARRVAKAAPLGRVGTPEDVARAVLFLLQGSEFLTGTALAVDGGRSLS